MEEEAARTREAEVAAALEANKVGLRVLTASQLELQAELTSPLP